MASKLKCSISESECKNSKNGNREDINQLAIRCGIPNPKVYSNREKLCAAIVAKYRETGVGGLGVPAPVPVSPASSIARSVTSTTSTTELLDDIKDFVLPVDEKSITIDKLKKVADKLQEQYKLVVRKNQNKPELYNDIKKALDKIKSSDSRTTTSTPSLQKKDDFLDDIFGSKQKPTIAVKPPTKILSASEEEEEELKRRLAEKQKARKEREEKEKADREKAAREAALVRDREKKEEQEREKARILKEREEKRKQDLADEAARRAQDVRKKEIDAKKREIEDKPTIKPQTTSVSTSGDKGVDAAIKKTYNVGSRDFKSVVSEIIDDLGSYSEIESKHGDIIGDEKTNFKNLRIEALSKIIKNNNSLEKFKNTTISNNENKSFIIDYLKRKKELEERVPEVIEVEEVIEIDPSRQKIEELKGKIYSDEVSDDVIATDIITELIKLSIMDTNELKRIFNDIVSSNLTIAHLTFEDDMLDEIIENSLSEVPEIISVATELIPVSVTTEEVPMLEPARRLKSPLGRRAKFIKGAILTSSEDNCYPDYELDCPNDLVCDIDNDPPKCIDRSLANLKQKNIKDTEEYNLRGKRIIGNKDTIKTLKTILKDALPQREYSHDTYNIIDTLIRTNIENNISDKNQIFTNVFSSLESTDAFTPEQLVSNKLKYYVKRMINLLIAEKETGLVVVPEPIAAAPNIDSIIQKYKHFTSDKVILNKVKKYLVELGIVFDENIIKEKISDMLAIKEAEEEEEEEEEEEAEEEEVPVPDVLPTISTREIIEGNMLPRLLDTTDEASDSDRQLKLAQNAIIKCLGLA